MEIDCDFFVRKEFDLLASDRDSVVAGLRFFIPLSLAERGDANHKLLQIDKDGELADWEREILVKSAYLGLSNQRERSISQHYRYLRSKERTRRVLAQYDLGEAINLSAAIARLKTLIEASIELIHAKQAVYHRVNNVLSVARLDFSPELLESFSLLDDARRRQGNRSIYIWSKEFNRLSNRILLNIMETKGIQTAIVSNSTKINKDKLNDFIALTKQNARGIELIVGTNEWIFPAKHDSAVLSVKANARLADTLHLDIEPQTFNNYSERKAEYQQEYIDLIKVIKQSSPDVSLNLSVPFHWENETYIEIAKHAKLLTIMLYENDSIEVLTRRMNRILQHVAAEQIAIALRPKDFASEYELENTIRRLKQDTGVKHFAIHDLADVINNGAE